MWEVAQKKSESLETFSYNNYNNANFCAVIPMEREIFLLISKLLLAAALVLALYLYKLMEK